MTKYPTLDKTPTAWTVTLAYWRVHSKGRTLIIIPQAIVASACWQIAVRWERSGMGRVKRGEFAIALLCAQVRIAFRLYPIRLDAPV